MPPAFNLSQDQTLHLKLQCLPKETKLLNDRTPPHEAVASVTFQLDDQTRQSAHTNYLIELLKNVTGATGRSREAHYTRSGLCVNAFKDGQTEKYRLQIGFSLGVRARGTYLSGRFGLKV